MTRYSAIQNHAKIIFVVMIVFFGFTTMNKIPQEATQAVKISQAMLLEKSAYKQEHFSNDSGDDDIRLGRESEARVLAEVINYSKNSERKIIFARSSTTVYAPPNETFIKYAEFFFEKDQLFLANLRYYHFVPSETMAYQVTECIVYFEKKQAKHTFKREYSYKESTRLEIAEETVFQSFNSLNGFSQIDNNKVPVHFTYWVNNIFAGKKLLEK